MRILTAVMAVIILSNYGSAEAPERDFSGKWSLHRESTGIGDLAQEPEPFLNVEQSNTAMRCASEVDGKPVQWSYALNGDETKYKIGAETRNSAVKWEGAALLVNTLVSGQQDYVIMDRWKLSSDRTWLTITRQVMRNRRQTEGRLVYRRAAAGKEG